MIRVAILPKLESFKDKFGGVYQMVKALYRHLPEYHCEIVAPGDADVVHCLSTSTHQRVGVYTNTGWLYGNTHWESEAIHNMLNNLHLAKVLTTPSKWMAKHLYALGGRQVRVIPNGVDVDEWTPQPNPSPYVLWGKGSIFVGERLKAAKLALEVAKQMPDTHFIFTGLPPRETAPMNVQVIGIVHHNEWKRWMQNASVYLSTAVEPGAIAVVEALAAGVPVVSIKEGATIEYTYFLGLEADTVDTLAGRIRFAIARRSAFSFACRYGALDYDWGRIIPKYVAAYKEAM